MFKILNLKSQIANIFCVLCVLCGSVFSSPTFTTSENSYYGRVAPIKKLTIAVTPSSNEPNIGGRSDACDITLFAELLRLSYTVTGSDDAFTILLTDDTGRTIFSKADCSTSASYALDEAGTSGTKHHGIAIAGALTADVCDLGKTEIQTLTVTTDHNEPNGGTFEVLLNDINSKPIAYDCNAAVLEAALEDMNNIDDISVDGNSLYGESNSLVVTFLGDWYGDDVNMLAIDCNGLTADYETTTFTGVEVETQKGAYDTTGVTLTIYYRDDRY